MKRDFFVSRSFQCAMVCALLGAFVAQVIWSARSTSATYDEVSHLPAGYTYLRWHDYRLNPEHPPLVKELAALPLLWGHVWPDEPKVAGSSAAGGDVDSSATIEHAWARGFIQTEAQWIFGQQFLYGVRPELFARLRAEGRHVDSPWDIPTDLRLAHGDFNNDADGLLFRGRMAVLLLGTVLGILVFSWARDLSGFAGGILALTLFCFDPNFIAHSGLVTTDVGASLFIFGTMYFLWRYCSGRGVLNLAGFLLFFGMAFAAKFSAVLLVPFFWLTVGGLVVSRQPWRVRGVVYSTWSSKAAVALGLFLLASAAAYVSIWAAYSFRYSAAADPAAAAKMEGTLAASDARVTGTEQLMARYHKAGQFTLEGVLRMAALSRSLAVRSGLSEEEATNGLDHARLGLAARSMLFAQAHHLLPEAFIYGFAYADWRSIVRASFLRGQYSETGFRDYFFWAFIYKTPLPAIILILLGIVMVFRTGGWVARSAFLVLPVALYVLVAVAAHLSIGLRHLLPVYPFLYVLAGGVVVEWKRLSARVRSTSGAVSLVVIGFSAQVVLSPQAGRPWQWISPHYLAYFNELAGGPLGGVGSLVDSNLDWGQGLKDLKRWLDDHGVKKPIYLCYFGRADPRYYQIAHHTFLGGYELEPQEEFSEPPAGSLIAISATKLQGIYLSPDEWRGWRQLMDHSRFVGTAGYAIYIFEYGSAVAPGADPGR